MDLHILFIQRKESYPGECAPEALVVWDEYSVDENPEGFENAIKLSLAGQGSDVAAHRVIRVRVDQERIHKLLVKVPTVDGSIIED
jgi:hypothetical protein